MSESDTAHAQLIRRMRSGELRPGMKLSERTLASEMGLSRMAVKYAMYSLDWLGVVERRPRSGTYMRELPFDEALRIVECRAALESATVRLATQRMSDKELLELMRVATRSDELTATANPRVVQEWEYRFHDSVAQASGNARLAFLAISQGVHQSVWRLVWSQPRRTAHGTPDHRAIVAAMQSRDAEAAAQAIWDHILSKGCIERLRKALAKGEDA